MTKNKSEVGRLAYKINDAAAALGLSRRTIYRLIDEGTLRTTKAGSSVLIPASDVQAVIESAG